MGMYFFYNNGIVVFVVIILVNYSWLYFIGLIGRNCDYDIDECVSKMFCSYGICINIFGSFYCICLFFVYGLKC